MVHFLPFDDNCSGDFCIVIDCDDNLTKMNNMMKELPRKPYLESVQKPINPNGVPNFYYEKPMGKAGRPVKAIKEKKKKFDKKLK
jgi:hypothetical protein